MEEIILVDENDAVTGKAEKLEVHKTGQLHRAFSIFIFNSSGEILLQKRSLGKYHSKGLWTNTCCSHQLPDKSLESCAIDRLIFEMGLEVPLIYQFKFHYRAELEDQLIENEIDHVYFGFSDDLPRPNPNEVMDWRYISPSDLQKEMDVNPEDYTAWLQIALKRVILHL